MTRIAILGCGWLGFPLATHLLESGYTVLGSSTSIEKEKMLVQAGIQAFTIDLENIKTITKEFLNADELIITIPPKAKNYAELIKNIIPKIEASTIKRVTYTSSISVYGNATGIVTEKTKTKPLRDSVQQIVAVEQLLLNNSNFATIIVRLGGLIGPNRHPVYHLSNKILKAPSELINLIHLEDCISTIHKLLKTKNTQGVYNLVHHYHPTKQEYYSNMCKSLNLALPIINDVPTALKKEISSKKIISLLNYQFKNNLILS